LLYKQKHFTGSLFRTYTLLTNIVKIKSIGCNGILQR